MDLDEDDVDDGGQSILRAILCWASWEFFISTILSNPLDLHHSMCSR